MKTKVWAHRGASKRAPENTMRSFRLAVEEGADGIELDVHLSRDGELIVMHDDRVDRTFAGSGFIHDMELADLKRLKNKQGSAEDCSVPTLGEVFDMVKPTGLLVNIELKSGTVIYEGLEAKLLELVAAKGMEDRVIYSSFNHYSLLALKQANPAAKIGLLYEEGMVEPWKYAQGIGADAIHPFYANLLVPGLAEGCEHLGIGINAWTVDSPDVMKMAFQLGIDGIITNKPKEAIALRDK